MLTFLARRILTGAVVIFGVITILFFALHAMPGDPVQALIPDSDKIPPEYREQLIRQLELDRPLPVQFARTVQRLLTGGLVSLHQQRPVFELIGEVLPNTLRLAAWVIVLSYLFGVALGIFQAVRQYSAGDTAATVAGLVFYSMPGFWLALMLILVFSSWLRVLPEGGMADVMAAYTLTPAQQRLDRLTHLVLPVATLTLHSAPAVARYMRSSMLEVIRQDYVRTARAKGLRRGDVILKHALRNALLPIVTLLGLQLPGLFAGSVLVETVFSWPGMGLQIVSAIRTQDIPLVIANTFVFASLVVAGSLLADVLYALVDPRIRHA